MLHPHCRPCAAALLFLSAGLRSVAAQPLRSAPAASSVTSSIASSAAAYTTTFANFNADGKPVTRFDVHGDAVDAHDGEIALFEGLYYLYGTSYDCGFRWGGTGAPFCGFKAYSSPDLVHWTDRGYLFDATAAAWQKRCDGNTYGCYRPHVLYNAKAQEYVLWVNVYDNRTGFRVFTSKNPAGPFTEAAEPALAVNNNAPVAGLNNGDHDTFLDEDGTAYLAYTDWRTGGRIVIEKLDATFRTGTGGHVEGVTPGSTEAPSLFRRGSLYYLTYSDPNCGYCATGTSYRTAPAPLGPWTDGAKISAQSCGGQPSFVAPIPTAAGTAYLYGSDLWNNAAKNEALAHYYWGPLAFGTDGSIAALDCRDTVSLALAVGAAGARVAPPDYDAGSGADGFLGFCDIGGSIQRAQAFTATRTGTLASVAFTSFQDGTPDAGLRFEIRAADAAFRPTGPALYALTLAQAAVGWSPRRIVLKPDLAVTAGSRYALVIQSATSQGCYGLEYNDAKPYALGTGTGTVGGAAYSDNGGGAFTLEARRSLKFETTVRAPVALRGAPRDPVHRAARGGTGVTALGSRRPANVLRFPVP